MYPQCIMVQLKDKYVDYQELKGFGYLRLIIGKVMLNLFKKPYPFNDDIKHNAKVVLFISIGIVVFTLLVQPIEITSLSAKEIAYLVCGIALSTFVVLSLNLLILPSLFPKIFLNERWNIKKEILWNLWIMLGISSINLFVFIQIFSDLQVNLSIIGKIILLGILPVSTLIIINQDRLLRTHLKEAKELNRRLEYNEDLTNKLIHFESDYKKDEFFVRPDSILLIQSADNYIELIYKESDQFKRHLLRSTLKRAAETVSEYEHLFRCHRQYIVNVHHIKKIQGDSQGFKLIVDGIDFPIFVSRKYIKNFKARI